jgi:hypothetical protein
MSPALKESASIAKDLTAESVAAPAAMALDMPRKNPVPLTANALAGLQSPQRLFGELVGRFQIHDGVGIVDWMQLSLQRRP